jgi:ACS family tartrate transporter-like MFS transporter
VVAGVVVWFVLPNHPSECKWLNEKEQMLATSRLEGVEKGTHHAIRLSDVVATLREWRVLGCAFVYLTILTAFYSVSFFLPALMTDFGFSSLNANLMSTPVYFFAAVVMLANGYLPSPSFIYSDLRLGSRQCLRLRTPRTIFWKML